ncbi:MAG: CorA family divalent cation transporter, partial [Patescibacteria group bacterium]
MINSYFLENKKLVATKGYCESCQWLNMEGLGKEEIALIKKLGFHELAVEDILNGRHRTKVEDYKEYLFLSLDTIERGTAPLTFFCFLSRSRIVTIASRELHGDNEVLKRLQKNPTLFSKGSDFILYLLLDYLSDEYFPLLDNLDDELDKIEKKLFLHPARETAEKLLIIKRKIILFRRNLVALRDLLMSLRQFEGKLIRTENIPYFQDAFDHLIRLSDKTDLMRDMIV